jgi:hypothetical protein
LLARGTLCAGFAIGTVFAVVSRLALSTGWASHAFDAARTVITIGSRLSVGSWFAGVTHWSLVSFVVGSAHAIDSSVADWSGHANNPVLPRQPLHPTVTVVSVPAC